MTNELAKLNKATQMLAEAKSLDDIQHIVNIAEAAKAYARAAKLGLEAYNHAAEVKVRAERKAGEMLKQLERGTPKPYSKVENGSSEYKAVLDEHEIPTTTAHRWQLLADMPAQVFEQTVEELRGERPISTAAVAKAVTDKKKEQRRADVREAGRAEAKKTERYTLICADIRHGLPDIKTGSVDVVITDPPYPKEYLPLYEDLSRVAARILKPGGLAVVMSGQSYLPDVHMCLGKHLTYHWTGAYLTPGGQSAQLFPRRVNTFWKPLLLYTNGPYAGEWFGDVCKSAVNDNDKERHVWGQSESGMADIVQHFSAEGQLVADLFCGSSTTGVCAVRVGRRYIGVDIDQEHIDISAERLACLK